MMQTINFIYNPFYEFHAVGAEILIVLVIAALLMWSLIVERYLYFAFSRKQTHIEYRKLWQTMHNKTTDEQRLLKFCYLSEYRLQNERGIEWIRQLTKVSLLLGLLGTILGLISVFESQLFTASDVNRQISTAIARAIIPTTAGLLVSLSGLFFVTHLKNLANNSVSRLDYLLR